MPGENYPGQDTYALCRCGRSESKPFCDGSHLKAGFKDARYNRQQPYFEEADVIKGPGITLYDVPPLCALARFCHRHGSIWEIAATASEPAGVEAVKEDAGDCPSGRLVAAGGAGAEPIEPRLKPAISLVEMPAEGISGSLWVKGGIPVVSGDGQPYETRNRVTLCRCGASANKPFCDGSHHATGFNDGSEAVR